MKNTLLAAIILMISFSAKAQNLNGEYKSDTGYRVYPPIIYFTNDSNIVFAQEMQFVADSFNVRKENNKILAYKNNKLFAEITPKKGGYHITYKDVKLKKYLEKKHDYEMVNDYLFFESYE